MTWKINNDNILICIFQRQSSECGSYSITGMDIRIMYFAIYLLDCWRLVYFLCINITTIVDISLHSNVGISIFGLLFSVCVCPFCTHLMQFICIHMKKQRMDLNEIIYRNVSIQNEWHWTWVDSDEWMTLNLRRNIFFFTFSMKKKIDLFQ